jgi:hypothetical protein
MHLAIEPEDATTSSRRGPGGAARVDGGVVSLGVTVPAQERAHWCWAAIAVGLERYYGRPEHSQEALAVAVLGAGAPDGELDRDLGLDRALTAAGCYSHWSPGKPTLARLRFEINLGRPIAARIEWDGGVGHYVLVTGYDTAGDGLFIDDPRRGTARVGYAAFPRGYDRGGTWTESFWTSHPLTTSVEP